LFYSIVHYKLFVTCNRTYPLLGTAQGLALGQQHPFPWYPPVCTSLSDIPEGRRSADQLKAIKNRHKLPQKIPDAKIKQVRYVLWFWLISCQLYYHVVKVN